MKKTESSPTRLSASLLATTLAVDLRRLIDDLQAESRRLPSPTDPGYEPETRAWIAAGETRAIEILEETVASVDDEPATTTEIGPEALAPLRSYVEHAAAEARNRLDRSARTVSQDVVMFAVSTGASRSVRSAQARAGNPVEWFLSRLSTLLQRAENDDLQTTLCVVSQPVGGLFEIFPASASQRVRTARSTGSLAHVWRGIYRYRAYIKDRHHDDPRVYLDLVQPDRLTLDCRLERSRVTCSESVVLPRECQP